MKSYTKSVSAVLDEDVSDPAVLVEELLDVSFPDVVRQVAQKNSAPFSWRHLLVRDRASVRSSVFLKNKVIGQFRDMVESPLNKSPGLGQSILESRFFNMIGRLSLWIKESTWRVETVRELTNSYLWCHQPSYLLALWHHLDTFHCKPYFFHKCLAFCSENLV